jgi:hypothetical protein
MSDFWAYMDNSSDKLRILPNDHTELYIKWAKSKCTVYGIVYN